MRWKQTASVTGMEKLGMEKNAVSKFGARVRYLGTKIAIGVVALAVTACGGPHPSAFKNRVFEMLAGQVFDRAVRKMVNAFEERAARLYAEGSGAPGISSSSAHSAA